MIAKNNPPYFTFTRKILHAGLIALNLAAARNCHAEDPQKAGAVHPRIVNIYNFIRDNDFRVQNSEAVLFEATRQQVELLKQLDLPATFAFQYDALVDTNYQKLFKESGSAKFELGAWWEIPEILVKKAGLNWRGHHEWDPAADVGFSPGYTPDERRKLVDVYMADFKEIYGNYPKSVGSWFIDEVTLAYVTEKYGIVASCNCKDQVGTDGYTLWGGYWNQAYYPSRVNAYMPAQTEGGQIHVPVFRMLGSDPIYQHGTTPALISLEPVYREAGGSESWVKWFMNSLIQQPSLAFGYTQAGQENSFGWQSMKGGLDRQFKLFAEEQKAGLIQLQTLADSGRWFEKNFKLTPATSFVALEDWRNENRKTAWYDSRFYRVNLLWENNSLFIRDLHCFDENIVSPTHEKALTGNSLAYNTLPIVDSAIWAGSHNRDNRYPAVLSFESSGSRLSVTGTPIVKETASDELSISQTLATGGTLSIVCSESKMVLTGADAQGKPLVWNCRLAASVRRKAPIQSVATDEISYNFEGVDYKLRVPTGSGTCAQSENGDITINPNPDGKLVLTFVTGDSKRASKAPSATAVAR